MRDAGFTIRRAWPADAAHAARIIAAALADHALSFEPEGRDADVATFGARSDVFDAVAERGATVVGVVSVAAHEVPGVAWISKLFVSRDARRAGLGRALLRSAQDEARARGFHTVGLRTRRIFREALALYASEGYATREDPRVIEPGDLVLYRPL